MGSEMCIRDRRESAPVSSACDGVSRESAPVSYACNGVSRESAPVSSACNGVSRESAPVSSACNPPMPVGVSRYPVSAACKPPVSAACNPRVSSACNPRMPVGVSRESAFVSAACMPPPVPRRENNLVQPSSVVMASPMELELELETVLSHPPSCDSSTTCFYRPQSISDMKAAAYAVEWDNYDRMMQEREC